MLEEEAVIAGIVRGDAEAFAVVGSWIERAAGAFRARLGTHWEDLLQDSQLEVMRLLRAGRFRRESSLKTYVWRVVNHACLYRLRHQRRWRFEEADFDLEPGREPSPFESTRRRETAQLLLRLLERLPQECRELWRLILDGLSYQEMSGRLGVAEGTLRVRVLRCRRRAVAARDELLGSGSPAAVTLRAGETL